MSAAQRQASDPDVSAFVSAHAGTGKTKLLIDRVLRLMLAGADPGRILCLTYTKAAAAEMAIRLQRRLGEWVAMPDLQLNSALDALPVAPNAATRARARALFAGVLDLPGGMRIGTIHAFCQSLLKRFPLEAGTSPYFRLVEPADARAELEQAREAALPHADQDALATLAGLVTADGFAGLVQSLEEKRDRIETALGLAPEIRFAALRRIAGATHADEALLMSDAVAWPDAAPLANALRLAAHHASEPQKVRALKLLDWLAQPAAVRSRDWESWTCEFLTKKGEPRAPGSLANPKLAALYPDIVPTQQAEQARILRIEDSRRALRLAQASAALVGVAAPILASYAAAKDRRALLDYEDLISRTEKLLRDEGSAWVLYKLDGGLDHLLLDEVQDTSPTQWAIADRLTGDFFAGEGTRQEPLECPDLARSVFAVGDRKQSIYSFQGADPAGFDHWRGIFATRAKSAGRGWRDVVLDISYRSTAPVLALTDAVFGGGLPGVYDPRDAPTRHVPHRDNQGGRIELWPLAPRPEAAPHVPWTIPAQNQPQSSAPQTLVTEVARWIACEVADPDKLRPGDVLVLVRRRGDFDRALVRALKAHGVPVAGLDRMVLTEQPAVQDLLALCGTLLLPTDDLTLAEMLVSPLGGLSDESLMRLAATRTASLWHTLADRAAEQPDWRRAHAFLTALLARVDFTQPHALLGEALGPLGGRARLFARLGPEAAEPVDEFLAAALQYAAARPPSLQGFVHWLRQSAAEVKREAEAAGDAVRIMTVHGAKGLEAPVVILPDTTGLPPDAGGLEFVEDPGTGAVFPLWQPRAELRCDAVARLRDRRAQARVQEYHRLLYVALTRARDRLVICGWSPAKLPDGTWYELVGKGLATLDARREPFAAWPGEMAVFEASGAAPPKPRGPSGPLAAVPDWAGAAPDWRPRALPPEPALPRPLAPSRPDGVSLGPVPAARSPRAASGPGARARGQVLHTLLQHLPYLAADRRAHAATQYVSAAGIAHPAQLAGEALAVLDAPDLAPLFGPDSRAEQPITGVLGDTIVSGQVDRLAVLPDRVLIADYKSHASPPATPDAVPILYLRQMAAYRAVLTRLYPDRPIVCLLVWTAGPSVMELPGPLLDRHAPGSTPDRLDPGQAPTNVFAPAIGEP